MPLAEPTPKALGIRWEMSLRRTPLRHRCGYVPLKTCADLEEVGIPLRQIGSTQDLGYNAVMFQCPVCHQVMTEHEAYR